MGSPVQDLNSVLKGTTYLLTLKRVGVNYVLCLISLAIHLVLLLQWEAYWASVVELLIVIHFTISIPKEFMFKSSCSNGQHECRPLNASNDLPH
ncbi:hypothetical protein E6C27_scaffold40G001270 [Cucumis melo var. makuwa]|uniref:Uncharacterized protein n=1 Tax=Cucumis melo var. makuwa TaxID=1194695 RepID=A0A5A7VI99_CUCMM|nr:hypothetical protein E6C27_scaffold40G001270 [Cucumis melo var. makuwa]